MKTPKPREVMWGDGGRVTALLYGGDRPQIVFAHGAGTGQRHQLVAAFAAAVAERDIPIATFNYPFTEAGRKRPDGPRTLLACHAAVVHDLVGDSQRVVLGGRSMGGRMASMLVAGAWDGPALDAVGLLLHAYPLHPAGKPERLRIDHLDALHLPIQVVRGSRDALAREDLFDSHLRRRENVQVVDLSGADHSFRMPGTTTDELMERLALAAVAWVNDCLIGT